MHSGRVQQNTGNARFSSHSAAPAVPGLGMTLVADFDGDGDADVVVGVPVAGSQITSWMFLEQTGPLSFTDSSSARFPALPANFVVVSLSAGDIDGDTDFDVVMSANRDRPTVLLNDGSGQFTLATTPVGPTSAIGGEVHLADLDGDGDLDLLRTVIPSVGTPGLEVWSNDATGALTLVTTLPDLAVHILPVDYDLDTDIDLVTVSGHGTPAFRLWRNLGGLVMAETIGAFRPIARELSFEVAILDADDNGYPDLFVEPDVCFLNPTGSSGIPHVVQDLQYRGNPFSTTQYPRAADFDLDGRDDVLRDAHGLFLNTSTNRSTSFANVSNRFTETTFAQAAADVDGDGDVDLFGVGLNGPFLEIQRDDGTWDHRELTGFQDTYPAGPFVDLDGDGDLDKVVAERLLINDGRGQFQIASGLRLPTLPNPWLATAAEDLDGDGSADIAINTQHATHVLWNAGNGFFTASTQVLGRRRFATPHITDIDGDGDMDLIGNGIAINHGQRQFVDEVTQRMPPEFFVFSFLSIAGVIDLDGDGHLDLIDNFSQEYRNDGSGHFMFTGRAVPPPRAGVYLDFDLDGDLDAVITEGGAALVPVAYTNDGSLNFSAERILDPPSAGAQYLVVDIDEDNDPDVVTGGLTLINHHQQFLAPFKPRPGTDYELRLEFGPANAGSTRATGVLLGLAPARIPVLDWGSLRIDPSTLIPWAATRTLLAGERVASWVLPIPAMLPVGTELHTQGLVVEGGRFRLTNRVVDRVE